MAIIRVRLLLVLSAISSSLSTSRGGSNFPSTTVDRTRRPCFVTSAGGVHDTRLLVRSQDSRILTEPPSASTTAVMSTLTSTGNGSNLDGSNDGSNRDSLGAHWRVWTVAEELEKNGLSVSNAGNTDNDNGGINVSVPDPLTEEVVRILRLWGSQWAGEPCWQSILNKKSLLHEVEESIAALRALSEWLDRRREPLAVAAAESGGPPPPVTLVDVCCGKGIFSMIASYYFRGQTSTHVADILMLDKQADINWDHVKKANESAKEEGRPAIEAWGGYNLHQIDDAVERLESRYTAEPTTPPGSNQRLRLQRPLALVGIHLCKMLSPSCAGIVNALGPDICPFLCLAPCCLPRCVTMLSNADDEFIAKKKQKRAWSGKGGTVISVRTYENSHDRSARTEANRKRGAAYGRNVWATKACYLCSSEDHPIHECGMLPPDEDDRLEVFKKASAQMPCWKCGETGHFRADCPSGQGASKPRLALPPAVDLDVSTLMKITKSGGKGSEIEDLGGAIVESKVAADAKHENNGSGRGPFEKYCNLLATALDREVVQIRDVGLVNKSAHHDSSANKQNWNRDRKSIYIVATSS